MNKIIITSLTLCFMALIVMAGCEAQRPVDNGYYDRELEASVAEFAATIDPYERYTRNEIYAMLEEFMYEHPDVYASGFAVNSTMDMLEDFYYIYKDGTTFITIDGFDYSSVDKAVMNELQEQTASGEQFWSDEYIREDGSGNKITVRTFFTPVVNDSGKVIYVLTVDQIEERL